MLLSIENTAQPDSYGDGDGGRVVVEIGVLNTYNRVVVIFLLVSH